MQLEKTYRELDVRQIPAVIRHPKIFELFDSLAAGDGFLLINDHDPRPLYYQFVHERPDQFEWEYLQRGPEEWRVVIRKAGTPSDDAAGGQAAAEAPAGAQGESQTAPAAGSVLPAQVAQMPVAEIIARFPETAEVLHRHGVDSCCGGRHPLAVAAAAHGLDLGQILVELAQAVGEKVTTAGSANGGQAAGRQVVLDVREDLRQGREPFARIMAAVQGLVPGDTFTLYAPFEPLPLYQVLGNQGFEAEAQPLGDGDYQVTFRKVR